MSKKTMTKIEKFLCAALAIVTVALCPVLHGCGEDNDEEDDSTSCSEEFCLAWCIENIWPNGLDAGINPWGKRQANCLNGRCSCEESLCNPENCATYCKEDQGKQTGHCEMFDCICDD